MKWVSISEGIMKVEDLLRKETAFAKGLALQTKIWSRGEKDENTELPAHHPTALQTQSGGKHEGHV